MHYWNPTNLIEEEGLPGPPSDSVKLIASEWQRFQLHCIAFPTTCIGRVKSYDLASHDESKLLT